MKNNSKKQSLTRYSHTGGFSLVELIIVVAILGILAAIAIPAYKNYITTSKQSAARSVLEQFPILIETYRAETGRMCPDCQTVATHNYDETEIQTHYPYFRPKGNLNADSLYNYSLQFIVTGSNVTATATALPIAGKAPPGNIEYKIE